MTPKKQNPSRSIIIEILGWYGTVAIITAYALNSFNVISVVNPWYQILNGTGAVGIIILSLNKKAYQPAALNVVWALIAIFGLFQILIHPL